MKQNRMVIILLVVFLVFLPSCTARIDGTLAADGSAVLTVSMSLGQRIITLIQSLTAASGQNSGQLLDGPAISRSMSDAPGVALAALRNTSPSAIEGQVRISQVGEFLSIANGRGFITFEQGSAGGKCGININLDNGPVLLEMLSSEITEYLNALMAPIATGEVLNKNEYIGLITLFYSKAISDEIASSRIRSTIEFPGTITGVKGGTFSGRRATFDIPLLDLLVLETPLVYEVTWR